MSKIKYFGWVLVVIAEYLLFIIISIMGLLTTHSRNTKSDKDKTWKTFLNTSGTLAVREAAKWTMLADYLEKED